MKKIYLLAAVLINAVSFAQNVSFENITIGNSEDYWNGSDYSGTENPAGTFSSSNSEDYFQFNTVFDTTWGAAYGYWASGWSFSNQTSDTLTNLNGQYSSYAGGASDSSQYAIGQQNSKIYRIPSYNFFESIEISNSNYSAHSMLNGDQFAKQFGGSSGNDPDWFLLTIYAYNDVDQIYDSVEVYLADYRFSNNSQDYIVKDWITVDISSLEMADYLEFVMTSSDVGTWGMNTPSFFAIDNLTYFSAANIPNIDRRDINLYPNPAQNELFVNSELKFEQYQIFSLDGRLQSSGRYSSSSIDVSEFPVGTYYIFLTGEEGTITKSFFKN